MSVRRLITGATTASIVAASVALMAPAHADPTFTPTAADIVGVGSDTTMHAMTYLANGNDGVPGFNEGRTTGRLVSFDANTFDASGNQTNSTTVVLQEGQAPVTRPNGSGNGKKTLYGAGNLPAVDYARSSSALSTEEVQAGLYLFPFAKDTMALATDKVTNAPAAITAEQMLKIYKGEVTNWSELGGASAPIEVMVPQKGSGTFQFFDGELKKLNGGAAVVYPGTAIYVQEHDPAPLVGHPNAVAPFSIGRNRVAGEPLKIAGGWLAARAVYNVLRQADVSRPELQEVFGTAGFLCSPLASKLIADAGFDQLARQEKGGVCGVATQAASTNFTLSSAEAVTTTTTVVGASAAAGALKLTASVAGTTGAPYGLVSFFLDGAATPAAVVPLTAGKAVKDLSGISAGAHSVVAKYAPAAKSAYAASQSAPTAVTVLGATPVVAKGATKLVEKFKASYAIARSYKGKVLVKETATGAPTGKVVVKLGKKVVGKGTIKSGKVTLTLKKLKKGKNKLTATYAGDSKFAASKLKFKITVK
jgi:ABC-type phosphate transport system substrate-binding protein